MHCSGNREPHHLPEGAGTHKAHPCAAGRAGDFGLLQDAWLYVIRKGSHELLYANKNNAGCTWRNAHEPCYRVVFYRADKLCIARW